MSALRVATRLLGLFQMVVLARLLLPRDFGLFGIAALVMATLDALTQTGTESALIFSENPSRRDLDTAWSIAAARGLLLFGCAAAAAPLAASFFDAPAARLLIPALGAAFLLRGLSNVGVVYFRKDLRFRQQFFYEISGVVPNVVVSVLLAVLLRNAWALVLGMIAASAVQAIASYRLHPYRPQFAIDRVAVRELYRFGRWIFGTNVLTFLANKGDDLFVGRVLGVAPLGLYQMAFRIGEKPREDISSMVSQVALPAYALVREEPARLAHAYRMGLEAATALTFPLAAALIVLAPELTGILLGPEWLPMVPALRILTVAGAVRAILAIGGNLAQGVGHPEFDFGMNFVRLATLAVAIYPLYLTWGLKGAAGAVLVSLLAAIPFWIWMSTRFAHVSPAAYLEALGGPLAGALAVVAAVGLVKMGVGAMAVPGFLGACLAGLVAYAGYAYFAWRYGRFGPVRAWVLIRTALASGTEPKG